MRFSRWMAAPVAAAALMAAGSVAFAASGSAAPTSGSPSAFWSAVASKVGVPASTLESAVRSVAQKDRPSGMRFSRMAHPRMARRTSEFGVRRAFLSTAAKYLGITPKTLMSDLRGGKSLAQVATAQGKSVSGLESALSAKVDQAIDALVQRTWTRPQSGTAASSTSGSAASSSSSSSAG
jgi:hypothetical protein